MKNIKTKYLLHKAKNSLKTKTFMIAMAPTYNAEDQKAFIKSYKTLGFSVHKINNTSFKSALKKSTLKNYLPLISGPIIIITQNKASDADFLKVLNQNREPVIGFKINNRVYSPILLKSINSLKFSVVGASLVIRNLSVAGKKFAKLGYLVRKKDSK